MQAQSLKSTNAAGISGGPVFSKEAAALVANAKAQPANALEGVSHAMMFR